jgi:hypothetical protein
MRKLLGTVQVWIDTQETEESSHEQFDSRTKCGEILLTPMKDKIELEKRGLEWNPRKSTATALAHEFGHLITDLLGMPEAYGDGSEYEASLTARLNSESAAWNLATIANPKLDRKQMHASLDSYAREWRDEWEQHRWEDDGGPTYEPMRVTDSSNESQDARRKDGDARKHPFIVFRAQEKRAHNYVWPHRYPEDDTNDSRAFLSLRENGLNTLHVRTGGQHKHKFSMQEWLNRERPRGIELPELEREQGGN